VVGLYHPRCFVVVLSALKHPKSGDSMAERLRALISKPMEVLGQNETLHVFTPHLSVGAVTVTAASAIPGHVIDEAEQMALASERDKPSTRGTLSALVPARP
jgi:GGDEF domain-containing protein